MKAEVDDYQRLKVRNEEVETYLELAEEGSLEDVVEELDKVLADQEKEVEQFEIKILLSGKYDHYDCIVSLNSGAGGTDAQDWTQMLLRMYARWFEKNNFQFEVADQMVGEEAGLKSATLVVKGEFAYGLLKNESGIHRLVRLSPFNANNKRQTSFAAVDVIPEIKVSDKTLTIDPKELKVDTFKSSGAGGQHVNKTDSAVRITHIPTGIVVQSQHSRSQFSNRETAMTLLKSKLIANKEKEHRQKISEFKDNKEIAWGNQIRSYVFHPYKLVKDLRTNLESSDIQNIMNGDISPFIYAQLRLSIKEKKKNK